MPLDHDGKIRMDCSSPYAMASLIGLKDRFDLAFGNDADSDRHGIVDPGAGLMNPNHYLAVAIEYLFRNRPRLARGRRRWARRWSRSAIIDRVAERLGRRLVEVPVGFKWFVPGLLDGIHRLRRRGERGRELPAPGRHHLDHRQGRHRHGSAGGRDPVADRQGPGAALPRADRGAGRARSTRGSTRPPRRRRRRSSRRLRPEAVKATTLAGDPITARITRAPGNGAAIGGLKVTTAEGWFAARPSGTEDVYKIYAESFRGQEHLARILDEARSMVGGGTARVTGARRCAPRRRCEEIRRMPTTDFLRRDIPALRKTVFRLGLSFSFGLDEAGAREALERMQYVFLATRMPVAPVREALARDWERYVVAGGPVLGYLAGSVREAVEKQLRRFGTDYLDVLQLYWLGKMSAFTGPVQEEMARLRQEGKVRALGVSIHDRPRAGRLAEDSILDLLMVRYNAAHPGAEREIFPHLARRRPAVVAYTATSWRKLLRAPRGWTGRRADARRLLPLLPHQPARGRGAVRAQERGRAAREPGGPGAGPARRRGAGVDAFLREGGPWVSGGTRSA